VLRSVARNPLGMVGAALLLVVVLVAILASALSPHPPNQVNFSLPFQTPGTVGYLLGTDDLGRDILSRTMHGIRVSLQVGSLAVVLAVVFGTVLGLLAGYWHAADIVAARLADVTLAFPFLITAVAFTAISGASGTNAAIAIGISQIPVMFRVVRAATLQLRDADFVVSARAMDASSARVLLGHILPNVASPIIVQATVIFPIAVIGEAILSYLGLGNQPPEPSLGTMLADAQSYLSQSPTAALFPGIAIAAICLGFNLLGDALSDAVEPTNGSS
jgi:peptide/nickel transport system permease protein